MKAAVRLVFGFLLVIWGSGCIPGGPKAQVTVHVIDDTGNPVEGALVAVLGVVREQEGKTDKQGRFVATIRNRSSKVEMVIRKKGYYAISRHIYEFNGGYTDNRWQPWNPELHFLLARKRNSVVLIQKFVHGIDIPSRNQPAGYDLVVGDWVAPAGKGLVSDFVMLPRATITNGNATTNRLDLKFSNPSDGLIRTNIHWRNDYGLRLPPLAPESGYSNKWELFLHELKDPQTGIIHTEANWSEDDNYYFRVRSKVDSTGRIQSAIYGKIYRGILYGPPRTLDDLPSITFHYYVNPDGSRNLESRGERPDNDDP